MSEFATPMQEEITLEAAGVPLAGNLAVPRNATAIVVFAHGSGSSRFSRRNRQVADYLNRRGLATLLFDLLSEQESLIDERTAEYRFDIPLLGERLVGALDWLEGNESTGSLRPGLFGASTGAAAALIAAAEKPHRLGAVVSRGGRPDLADRYLSDVSAPTLLIVGGNDPTVLDLNKQAMQSMQCPQRLEIIPGATHLFEEAGKLEQVCRLAGEWFSKHLAG